MENGPEQPSTFHYPKALSPAGKDILQQIWLLCEVLSLVSFVSFSESNLVQEDICPCCTHPSPWTCCCQLENQLSYLRMYRSPSGSILLLKLPKIFCVLSTLSVLLHFPCLLPIPPLSQILSQQLQFGVWRLYLSWQISGAWRVFFPFSLLFLHSFQEVKGKMLTYADILIL